MKLLVYAEVGYLNIFSLLYIKQHKIKDSTRWHEIPYRGYTIGTEYYDTGSMWVLENRYTLL